MKEYLLWIIGILILISFIKIFGLFPGGNEIKAYSALCSNQVELNRCNNPSYTGDVKVYTVNVEKQYVLNSNGGYIVKYTKCAVKDRENWQCSFDDNSGKFGFALGQYYDNPNYDIIHSATGQAMKKTFYPSRFEYININSKNCGVAYPLCYIFEILTL